MEDVKVIEKVHEDVFGVPYCFQVRCLIVTLYMCMNTNFRYTCYSTSQHIVL